MKRLLFLLVISLTAHAMDEKRLNYLKPRDNHGSQKFFAGITLTDSQKKYLEKVLQYGFLYKSHYTDCEVFAYYLYLILGLSGAVLIPVQMILNSYNPSKDIFDGVLFGSLLCSVGCFGGISLYTKRYLISKKQNENRRKYIDEGRYTLGSIAMTIKRFLEEGHQGLCSNVYCISCKEKNFREYCKKCPFCKVVNFQERFELEKEIKEEHYKNYKEGCDFLMNVLNGIVRKTEIEGLV